MNCVHFIADEDSGGVSNGIPTVAPESATTSHTTTQVSDTRGVLAFVGGADLCIALQSARLQCFSWRVRTDKHGQHLLHECRIAMRLQHSRILSAFL